MQMQADRALKVGIAISPFVFLLHELEELFTVGTWVDTHGASIPDFIQPYVDEIAHSFGFGVLLIFLAYALAAALVLRQPFNTTAITIFVILLLTRLVNVGVHVLQAAQYRGYTPGLLTALVVVAPFGAWLLRRVVRAGMVPRGAWRSLIIAAVFVHFIGVIGILIAASAIGRVMG